MIYGGEYKTKVDSDHIKAGEIVIYEGRNENKMCICHRPNEPDMQSCALFNRDDLEEEMSKDKFKTYAYVPTVALKLHIDIVEEYRKNQQDILQSLDVKLSELKVELVMRTEKKRREGEKGESNAS